MNMSDGFTFDDVLIKPRFSFIKSRKDVKIDQSFLGCHLNLPVVSSNMDTVTGTNMALAMAQQGGIGCLHRFCSIENNIKLFHDSVFTMNEYISILPWVSVGLGEKELERAEALIHAGAEVVVVDVAHGASIDVVKQVKSLQAFNPASLVVGNFANKESIEAFIHHLGNKNVGAFKVGIGGGCFAGDTRILMADGTYKDIKDIKIHDRVINKNGKPVEVIGTSFSGFKKVKKYRSNNFYQHSYVTPDHEHWIGDYSSRKDIQHSSLYKILDQPTRTDESKYKWKRLSQCNKSVFLLPKNIDFEMNNSFTFDLGEFYESRRGFKDGFKEMQKINPSYDLGYLIGTFLGDGHSKLYCTREEGKRNTAAQTTWYFGKNEIDIVNKVGSCLKNVFDVNTLIKETRNMILIENRNNFIARFFMQFGKKQNKHLPNKYLCSDEKYLAGIYDGLLDSDGHYAVDGRNSLTNTSVYLIELFMFLNYKLKGYYPSISRRAPTTGNLKNINIDNCKEAFTARTVLRPEYNHTKEYQICRTYSIDDTAIEIATYDIEVDCETHSFIANNVIVHNSACTTRLITGCGAPGLSSVIDCVASDHPIIADGGMRNSGDICKALAAGAKVVFLGRMLAGTDESPGKVIKKIVPISIELDYNPESTIHENLLNTASLRSFPMIPIVKKYKNYRGSASQESYVVQNKIAEWRAAEGESMLTPYVGPLSGVLQQIEGGLRSALSYVGASNLNEFTKNAELIRISGNSVRENLAHGKL